MRDPLFPPSVGRVNAWCPLVHLLKIGGMALDLVAFTCHSNQPQSTSNPLQPRNLEWRQVGVCIWTKARDRVPPQRCLQCLWWLPSPRTTPSVLQPALRLVLLHLSFSPWSILHPRRWCLIFQVPVLHSLHDYIGCFPWSWMSFQSTGYSPLQALGFVHQSFL